MLNLTNNQKNENYSIKSYPNWPIRLVKMKTVVIPSVIQGYNCILSTIPIGSLGILIISFHMFIEDMKL